MRSGHIIIFGYIAKILRYKYFKCICINNIGFRMLDHDGRCKEM